jgi:hypothetical protein
MAAEGVPASAPPCTRSRPRSARRSRANGTRRRNQKGRRADRARTPSREGRGHQSRTGARGHPRAACAGSDFRRSRVAANGCAQLHRGARRALACHHRLCLDWQRAERQRDRPRGRHPR